MANYLSACLLTVVCVFALKMCFQNGNFLSRSRCLSLLICSFLLIVFQVDAQNNISIIKDGRFFSIKQGLAAPEFAAAYRKVFQPYLGLKWVASPVLEEPSREVVINNGGVKVLVFFACRPHACGNEKLVFVFDPMAGKGWGAVSIRSDVEEAGSVDSEIEWLIKRNLEGRK